MQFQRILCLLLLIATLSCREDYERNIATQLPSEPTLLDDYQGAEDLIMSSVKGIVTDNNKNPISNASVNLNGLTTTTDKYGHFFYTEVQMNANGSVVNVSSTNYQQGSKLFYPKVGAIENLEIVLNTVENDEVLDGLSASTVDIAGGIQFSYPENAFLLPDGSIYTETVHIASSFIDKENSQFSKSITGNLQAVDIRNQLVGLVPNAFIQISITDDQGNDLMINDEADVFLTLPNGINSDASVWYYADAFGLYTINSEFDSTTPATIKYKHNTSLLIAKTMDTELRTLDLLAANGIDPLANIEAEILDENNNPISQTYSNNQGQISMSAPLEVGYKLQIKDACGNVAYNDVWPNSTSELTLAQVNTKTLSGDVYDCSVLPQGNNVIRIQQGERLHYHYEPNPQFTLLLQTCNQGIVNVTALEDSNVDVNTTPEVSIVTNDIIGDLFTCLDPSINQLKLVDTDSGVEYIYPITSTAGSTGSLTTFRNFVGEGNEFSISFNGIEADDYSAPEEHSIERIYDDASGFRISGDADIFEVVRFGNTERVSVGSFEGSFENILNNEIINVRGNFNFYFQE